MTMLRLNVDASAFARLGNAWQAAGKNAPVALAWGINNVGRKALTQMRRSLVGQTGMKYGVFVRALRAKSASAGNLEYRITSKGGNVRLKFFSPKETRAGTTAAPWGKRTLYGGAFMRGGQFPNRVALRMGRGNVFKRVGRSRLPIKTQRSDLYIPDEMIKGASKASFDKVTSTDLEAAAVRALYAILSGVGVSARNFR